jgi:pyruvate-ferredoxin/flavodoxin oxidoreductase
VGDDEKEAFTAWIAAKNDASLTKAVSAKVVEVLNGKDSDYAKDILSLKQFLAKRSIWVFGGDGWAYDIGFGGLDHVLASGQDVTCCTGFTKSIRIREDRPRSTTLGAVAKFAAPVRESQEGPGMIAMSYGYFTWLRWPLEQKRAYLKALRERKHIGPVLIIAYSPCIYHGCVAGWEMQEER